MIALAVKPVSAKRLTSMAARDPRAGPGSPSSDASWPTGGSPATRCGIAPDAIEAATSSRIVRPYAASTPSRAVKAAAPFAPRRAGMPASSRNSCTSSSSLCAAAAGSSVSANSTSGTPPGPVAAGAARMPAAGDAAAVAEPAPGRHSGRRRHRRTRTSGGPRSMSGLRAERPFGEQVHPPTPRRCPLIRGRRRSIKWDGWAPCAAGGPRRAGRSGSDAWSAVEDAQDLAQAGRQGVHIGLGRVDAEGRSGRGRQVKPFVQRHRAVMAGPDVDHRNGRGPAPRRGGGCPAG